MAAPARRSSFFFMGRLAPAELANFNLQNVPVRDRGAIVEVMGRAIAIWWPARPRKESDDLADAARAWLRTIPAAYYLITGIALEPTLTGWVEALDVDVKEAIVGFADARFLKVPTPAEDDPINEPMRDAIALAGKLRRRGDLERASHEILAAGNDTSPQAFLNAYRALECVRRTYDADYANRKQAWEAMGLDMPVDEKLSKLLTDAAEAVRHGDVPARSKARHTVNVARSQRVELIGFARDIVRQAIERQMGVGI